MTETFNLLYVSELRGLSQKSFTNTYTDEFLGNISFTDNGSDHSDGERSDSNIDMLVH